MFNQQNLNLLSHYDILFSNIYFNQLWLMFKIVLQTFNKQEKGFTVESVSNHFSPDWQLWQNRQVSSFTILKKFISNNSLFSFLQHFSRFLMSLTDNNPLKLAAIL